MERILSRKPLTPAELGVKPCTVCVTGAAGYIASTIVCRLMAAGHTVHATFRQKDDEKTVAALKAVPGAAGRLKWFEADLMQPGSFDEAIKGCKYVIHTAAPVKMNCPPNKAFSLSINPVVQGVWNVLGAVNREPVVEKVVMTSSIYAAYGSPQQEEPGHVLTEADWNLSFSTEMPYYMAKTISEWEAWALASQQSSWQLVTINPANVLGPPLAASPQSESIATSKKMLDGSIYPFVPPLDTLTVDIADVAAAHCLAMITPEAHGRYIICERTSLLTDIAATLRQQFPAYRVPSIKAPYWLAAVVFKLTGMLGLGWLKATYGRTTPASSQKALTELKGLGPLIPLEQTLHDMVEAMVQFGVLPRKGTPAPKGSAGSRGSGGAKKAE